MRTRWLVRSRVPRNQENSCTSPPPAAQTDSRTSPCGGIESNVTNGRDGRPDEPSSKNDEEGGIIHHGPSS